MCANFYRSNSRKEYKNSGLARAGRQGIIYHLEGISGRAPYGKLDADVKITSEISATNAVMLDTSASKGLEWEQHGKMDLALFQNPDSSFLYILAVNDHPEHLLNAFDRGECMRVVKWNSSESRFLQYRELFRYCLLAS